MPTETKQMFILLLIITKRIITNMKNNMLIPRVRRLPVDAKVCNHLKSCYFLQNNEQRMHKQERWPSPHLLVQSQQLKHQNREICSKLSIKTPEFQNISTLLNGKIARAYKGLSPGSNKARLMAPLWAPSC